MSGWLDITAEANWEPKFYPYSTETGCVWRYGAAEASAFVYAFSGGEWVGPALQSVPPGDVVAASLPVLAYVGALDLSGTSSLRVTCRLGEDVTIAEGGFHRFIMVATRPDNAFGVDAYFVVASEELELGFYASGTEFIVEGTCDVDALQYVTALFAARDVDNCGMYLNYATNALTITKIEVYVETPPAFWTDFVGCEETLF